MGAEPDERQETVALVTEELDRMNRIVEDLLLLAKAEQPDFVQPAPLEIAEFTTDVTIKARALGDRNWRIDACATGEISADRQRLTQAMLNLARNAIDHTPPDAEAAIGSAWDDDGIRFWVRDTGPGVADADRDRIFERFARGGSGRRRSDGAGLGPVLARPEEHGVVRCAHSGRHFVCIVTDSPGANRQIGPHAVTASS